MIHGEHPCRARARAGSSAGFTLLEVLLVLALIALMGGLFVGAAMQMSSRNGIVSPQDLFWNSVRAAQELALKSEKPVSMFFDLKEKKLVWSNGTSGDAKAVDEGVVIQFMSASKAISSVLIAGQAYETQEIPNVKFFPDGTCEAFRVQLRLPAGPIQLAIDPWTCAQVLPKKP